MSVAADSERPCCKKRHEKNLSRACKKLGVTASGHRPPALPVPRARPPSSPSSYLPFVPGGTSPVLSGLALALCCCGCYRRHPRVAVTVSVRSFLSPYCCYYLSILLYFFSPCLLPSSFFSKCSTIASVPSLLLLRLSLVSSRRCRLISFVFSIMTKTYLLVESITSVILTNLGLGII